MHWFISDFNVSAWRLIKGFRLESAPSVTLVYGPKGIGKSTLLRYLYQQTELKYGSRITDALSFTRQYTYAAHEKKLNQFRQLYRTTQLLLFDDLQCLLGKNKTMEELLHTYEQVIGSGGKMVVALEGSLDLAFLGERLASRFLSGVVIPIKHPANHEIEMFLKDYARVKRLYCAPEVLSLISEHTANLADALESISKFIQFADLQEDELSVSCFRDFWEKEEDRRKSAADPNNIAGFVCQLMGITLEDLKSSDRKQALNEARQLAIYALRSLCQLSYPELGRFLNRNHNTMLTSYQKMQEKLAKNQELQKKYQLIADRFEKQEG